MNKSFPIVLISFVFLLFSLQARTPENLAGTDIFTDIDLSQITHTAKTPHAAIKDADVIEDSATESDDLSTSPRSSITTPKADDSKRSTPTPTTQCPTKALPIPQMLALSNLNLCFGAELFITGVAQALYLNGDIIRQIEELDKTGKKITKTCFYKDIINKEPLRYKEIDPLALLMRIFFYQTPGTASLANFKVSEGFRFNNDKRKSLYYWAFFVATAVQKTYEFEQGIITKDSTIDEKSFTDAKNALHCNVKIGKISFEQLLNDCIKFAKANNLGAWFVVRLLMAGTYELFGHDKTLIFDFYNQLKTSLTKEFNDQKSITDKLKAITIPNPTNLPSPFIKDALADEISKSDAYQAFILSKEIQGIFEPLTYRYAQLTTGEYFSDCFETLVQNLILKLIIQEDGSFNTVLVSESFKAFFNNYQNMTKQQQQEAYDDWAQLLVETFNERLLFRRIDNEICNSLRNLFIILNTVFDLNISILEKYENNTEQDTPETNAKLNEMYNAVNKALWNKINGDSDEPKTIIEIENINKAVDKKENIFTGNLQSPTGTIGFHMTVQRHGELEPKNTDNQSFSPTPKQIKTFPYFVGTINHRIDKLATHHIISYLRKPIEHSFLENILQKPLNNLIKKMIYTTTAQHYDLDKTLYCYLLTMLVIAKHQEIFSTAINAATDIATQAIQDQNLSMQKTGLNLFAALVTENDIEALPAATNAAKETIQNQQNSDLNKEVERTKLDLFKSLVIAKHEEAFPAATEAATNAIQNQDWQAQAIGLNLFKALFTANYTEAFTTATEAATNAIHSQNLAVQITGLNLFDALFAANHQNAFDAAIAAATQALRNEDLVVQKIALWLFNSLVTRKQSKAFPVATNAAKQALLNLDPDIHNAALHLFNILLLTTNYLDAFPAAIAAASQALQQQDVNIQEAGRALFNTLFTTNHLDAFPAAIKAATKAILHKEVDIQNSGLKLFNALFTASHTEAFPSAIKAATQAIQQQNTDIQEAGLCLFDKLVEANQGKMVYETLQKLTSEERIKIPGLQKLFEELQRQYSQ